MLELLVTSKGRRRVLALLWEQEARGSVGELAERAGVAFGSVHRELKMMERLGLVVCHREGAKEVYAANFDHPKAHALRALVARDEERLPLEHEAEVKRELVALGAPLRGVEPKHVDDTGLARTVVAAVRLARRDPVVARTLPIVLWNHRANLDVKALADVAKRSEDKHAVGFLMELAGELGGDRRLGGLAESLRDRRMTAVRDFYLSPSFRSKVSSDFPLATKWGFRMKMDEATFRALFEKFVTK